MGNTSRTCRHCGSTLVGRADKKYCSDQCRALAGNARKLVEKGQRFMRDINTKLKKNRDLLRLASPEGKTTLRRQVLELNGFDFGYFTHLYRTKQGNTYYFCYDYGYLLLPEEKMLIVNWQPYMNP
ncbi:MULTISPECIES: hypothetical protein [Rufibacter]|uniref:Putative nucleic acid-binding Zn ribbon protein n=1 Tax=Rufibacter quisquiliarum TaxID=1549639 RepID=A0A839GWE0_9BACT|nr:MULTISPECIES: hypothetical protein [Rufibacter]MBA9079765.1 putative nucleic acid-binding Zn ribbon protein [Rufibacter quisquiliarum]